MDIDTQNAIDTLKALKSSIDGGIIGKQAQSDAISVAIDQLSGTLLPQLDELKQVKVQNGLLQAELDALRNPQ